VASQKEWSRAVIAFPLLFCGVALGGVSIAAFWNGSYGIGTGALVAGAVLVVLGYWIWRRPCDEAAGEQDGSEQDGVAGQWGQSLLRKTKWGQSLLRKTKPADSPLRKTQLEISDQTRRTPRPGNKDAGADCDPKP
jgi:hypothetical protein